MVQSRLSKRRVQSRELRPDHYAARSARSSPQNRAEMTLDQVAPDLLAHAVTCHEANQAE
jgi:hypothetical protein